MLSIPEPLMELGVGQELKTALLKLSAALPEERLHAESYVRQRFHLDSAWWQQAEESSPHLRTINQAVLQDKRLYITYRLPFGVDIEQLIEPYGLVAKAGVWYLVYSVHSDLRTLRVSSLLDASLTEESFERPPDFDLTAFWNAW